MEDARGRLGNPNVAPSIWATAGVALSFLLAIALDEAFEALRAEAQSTFRTLPGRLFQAVTPLVLAAVMLGLAWLLFLKLSSARSSAVVFLTAGLIILGLYFSRFVPHSLPARGSPLRDIQLFVLYRGAQSRLFRIASFSALAGLVALIRGPKGRPAQSRNRNEAAPPNNSLGGHRCPSRTRGRCY
jgi:hypothetical protein